LIEAHRFKNRAGSVPFTESRLKFALVVAAISLFAASAPRLQAQDDPNNVPLGDIARSMRGQTAPRELVIDNDNLTEVVDDAESRREAGLLPMLSLDPGKASVHVSAPDVSCSLSFTAPSSASSDQLLWSDLPRSELAKLDGPASIDGDTLQVSLRNGSSWDLREVVIGLTIVRTQGQVAAPADYGNSGIIPSITSDSIPVQSPFQKQPDTTILLRVRGSAAPSANAVFRTSLNFALFPDQEWHWAIVKAKGIAPQSKPEAPTQSAQSDVAIPPPFPAVNGLLAPGSASLAAPVSPDPQASMHQAAQKVSAAAVR
jgi:hypothetical protein